MKITNKANLPEPIVKAITNDTYTKGSADYSASELLKPPQMARLSYLYYDQIEVDVADEIWKLFGTSVHYILEKSAESPDNKKVKFYSAQLHDIRSKVIDSVNNEVVSEHIEDDILTILNRKLPQNELIVTEERLYASIAGIRISGKPDYRTLTSIEDYKVTSVWKILKNDYTDWTDQLNIYRWIAKENGYDISSLKIIAILKDWKKYEKSRDDNYPAIPIAVINVEVKNLLDVTQFVLDRVRALEESRKITVLEELAEKFPCSARDRWEKPSTYAVIKEGNKRATKVFDTEDEATAFIGDASNYSIDIRQGESTRCLEFCSVNKWCKQFQDMQGQKTIITGDDVEPAKIIFDESAKKEETTEKLFSQADNAEPGFDPFKIGTKEVAPSINVPDIETTSEKKKTESNNIADILGELNI